MPDSSAEICSACQVMKENDLFVVPPVDPLYFRLLNFPLTRRLHPGNLDCLKGTLANVDNPSLLLDEDFNTPIHAATAGGNADILKLDYVSFHMKSTSYVPNGKI